MTTAKSPLNALQEQANKIARSLKDAERRELPSIANGEKISNARLQKNIKFAVVMDDKIITISMSWATIYDTSEAGIAEYILKQMRDANDAFN